MIVNPLNESSLAFPVLECVHIAGFVCGVGTSAVVALRLLGVGLREKSAAQLWRETMPWTLGGLVVAIFSGLLLFSIDPDVYYSNRTFLLKITFLALAVVFYYTAVRWAAAKGRGRAVAGISLGLWAGVLFGGIFLSFVTSSFATYVYPVLLWLHIVAIVVLGGMIVATYVGPPKWIAFGVAAACGVAMFIAKPGEYAHNPWFWVKMGLLAAIGVSFRILPRGVSLLLWLGVVVAARGPATIKDIMHSMVDPSGDFLFKSVQSISDAKGIREKAPRTDAEWADVRARVEVLLAAPDLLIAGGRMAAHPKDRSKDPLVENEPAEVQALVNADRTGFLRRAKRLHDAAVVAMRAVDAKDKDALFRSLDGVDKACESCHLHYWYPRDKRAQEAAKADGITD